VPVEADYRSDVLPSMVLLGVGFGLAFPSLMALAMSGASEHDSGLASGLVNTTQQVGGALGLAILASLSAAHTNGLLAASVAEPAALTNGYQLSFGIGAGLVFVALVVAFTVLRPAEEAEERRGRSATGRSAMRPDGGIQPAAPVGLSQRAGAGQRRGQG
jgi:hypothetical protein